MMRGPQKYVSNAAVEVLQTGCQAGERAVVSLDFPDYGAFLGREAVDDSRIYGVTDRGAAKEWGYSPPDPEGNGIIYRFNGSTRQLPLANAPVPLTSAAPEQFATEGPPEAEANACIRWANGQLFGNPDGLGSTVGMTLFVQAWEAARESEPVRQTFRAWKECMVGKGYDPPDDPLEFQPFPARTDGSKASAEESKTAVADVDCKRSARVDRTWASAVERAAIGLKASHRKELEAEEARIAAVVSRAEKYTGLRVAPRPAQGRSDR